MNEQQGELPEPAAGASDLAVTPVTWEHATWELRLVAQRLNERAQRRHQRTPTADQRAVDERDTRTAVVAVAKLHRLLGLDGGDRKADPNLDMAAQIQPMQGQMATLEALLSTPEIEALLDRLIGKLERIQVLQAEVHDGIAAVLEEG